MLYRNELGEAVQVIDGVPTPAAGSPPSSLLINLPLYEAPSPPGDPQNRRRDIIRPNEIDVSRRFNDTV